MEIAIRFITNFFIYFAISMSSYILTTKVFRWRVHKAYVILSLIAAAIDAVFIVLIAEDPFEWRALATIWELMIVANEFNLLIAYCICIEGKWYKRILVGLATLTLGSTFVDFLLKPLNIVLGPDKSDSIGMLIGQVVLAGVALLLLYVASLPGRKLDGKRFGVGLIWAVTFGILLLDVFLEATMLTATEESNNIRRGVRLAISGDEFLGFVRNSNLLLYFMLILISFFALYGINFFMSQRYYRRESEINANFLEVQAKYYENIQRNNSEIRSLRHDYRNHLTVLALLLENNDVDKAKAYIEDLSGTLKGTSSICNTGDQIADAILTEKILKAQSLGINLTVEGLFSYKDMKAVDTCSILGNILDNAIEAVSRENNSKNKSSKSSEKAELSSKDISIVFKKTDSFFMISETNPSLNPLKYDGSKVVSSKEDKELHGMGINNIRTSVGKYNGDVDVSCVPSPDRSGEYVFTINIVLPVIG